MSKIVSENGLVVTKLSVDCRAAAALILGEAFLNDPLLQYYFPSAPIREQKIEAFMNLAISLAHKFSENLVCRSQNEILGAAVVFPPGHTELSLASIFWRVMIHPSLWSLQALSRFAVMASIFQEIQPKYPHWYLFLMGVGSDSQNQGIGKSMMAKLIQSSERTKVPIYLETFNKLNLPFYEMHGFVVIRELSFMHGLEPNAWAMLRKG